MHTTREHVLPKYYLFPNTSLWRINSLRWGDCCGWGNCTNLLCPKDKEVDRQKDWLPDKHLDHPPLRTPGLWMSAEGADFFLQSSCSSITALGPGQENQALGNGYFKAKTNVRLARDSPGNLLRILVNEGFVLFFWEGELKINLPNMLHVSPRSYSFIACLSVFLKTMWQSCYKWVFVGVLFFFLRKIVIFPRFYDHS